MVENSPIRAVAAGLAAEFPETNKRRGTRSAARFDDRPRPPAGLAIAALAGRLIEKMLFGVGPLDPVTFVLVPIALVVTAGAAIAARLARDAHRSREGAPEPVMSRRHLRGAVTAA